MKRVAAALAASSILLLTAPAFAEPPEPMASIAGQESTVGADVELTLVADWAVGDSYQIEKVRGRSEIRNGTEVPTRTAHSITEIRVAEKSESGYLLISTLIEADLSNYARAEGQGPDMAAAMARMFEGMKLEIETGETGFPVRLRNAEAVVRRLQDGMNAIVDASTEDPEHRARVRAVMDQMMSPQAIEALAMKDVMVFYGLMGGSFQGGPAIRRQNRMIFPLTQSPLDADIHILLREYDRDKGIARIATQSIPDGEQVRQATQAWLVQMYRSQGKSAPLDLQLPPVDIRDTLEYSFDLKRGLPQGVVFQRYFAMGPENRREDVDTYRLITQ